MFELQVISSEVNVAQGKTATQSSTHVSDSGVSFDASNALDGNSNSYSHTCDKNPYWEVDLGGMHEIESIKIVNHWCGDENDLNQCLCRLSRAAISIEDENGNWVASQFLGDTCGKLEVDIVFSCEV
jgi:hypothetical protein